MIYKLLTCTVSYVCNIHIQPALVMFDGQVTISEIGLTAKRSKSDERASSGVEQVLDIVNSSVRILHDKHMTST